VIGSDCLLLGKGRFFSPWGFINVAGIRSPGLASAPAIAHYVAESLIEEKLEVKLVKKKRWTTYRRDIVMFRYLDRAE